VKVSRFFIEQVVMDVELENLVAGAVLGPAFAAVVAYNASNIFVRLKRRYRARPVVGQARTTTEANAATPHRSFHGAHEHHDCCCEC